MLTCGPSHSFRGEPCLRIPTAGIGSDTLAVTLIEINGSKKNSIKAVRFICRVPFAEQCRLS